jgi:hypothetical protein
VQKAGKLRGFQQFIDGGSHEWSQSDGSQSDGEEKADEGGGQEAARAAREAGEKAEIREEGVTQAPERLKVEGRRQKE